MLQRILNILLLALLLSVTACNDPVTDAEAPEPNNTVTGTLDIRLHQREVSGSYVCFELVEQGGAGVSKSIAKSEYFQITRNPFTFALVYPPSRIDQQKVYLLHVIVAEDQAGERQITSMSANVLTRGSPAELNLAIQEPPEPVP